MVFSWKWGLFKLTAYSLLSTLKKTEFLGHLKSALGQEVGGRLERMVGEEE